MKYPTIPTTTAFTQLGGGGGSGGAFVCVGMELLSSQNKTVPHPQVLIDYNFSVFLTWTSFTPENVDRMNVS